MEKHIFFVRHGESNSNVDGVHRGSKAELTEKGKQQAKDVASRIQRISVDTIISSPYLRARQTAEIISETCNLPIEESDLYIERRRPTAVHGLPHADPESRAIMKSIFDGYVVEGHRHSDEENLDDLKERARTALSFLASHSGEKICVVTHGLFLRVLFASVFDSNFSGTQLQNALKSLETSNTGISHFVLKEHFDEFGGGEGWVVNQWNDSEHLG